MKLVIDVQVFDLDRAVHFYKEVLSLECRIVENEWAAFMVGDAEIHLYLDGGVAGHVEFYVDDIEVKVASLRDNCVSVISGCDKPNFVSTDEKCITTFPWGRAAFFKDSEGNELAFVQDF